MEHDDCLNCNIPAEYCTGEPKTCRKKYERALTRHKAGRVAVVPKALYSEKYKKWGRDRYLRNKKNGICGKCGKRPAVKGMTLCEECRRKGIIYHRKYANEKSADIKRTAREQYHLNVKNGICPRCKKRMATVGYTTCEICRNKLHKLQKDYYERKKQERS